MSRPYFAHEMLGLADTTPELFSSVKIDCSSCLCVIKTSINSCMFLHSSNWPYRTVSCFKRCCFNVSVLFRCVWCCDSTRLSILFSKSWLWNSFTRLFTFIFPLRGRCFLDSLYTTKINRPVTKHYSCEIFTALWSRFVTHTPRQNEPLKLWDPSLL